jgi:DUF4097 and DUF4098 domain-containing protein YvlB
VTKEDIRSNFFLDPESTGQSKAKSAAELLQELNEDANVTHVEKVKLPIQWKNTRINNIDMISGSSRFTRESI